MKSRAPRVMLAVGAALLAIGSYRGLFVAPAEQFMGDTQRIMYVHVPTAWAAMLGFTWAAICATMFLIGNRWKWDHRLEAAVEMSIVLSFLLCMQGSIWAKPTWGVWWDWDPRLTTMAVLLAVFLGIAALRRFVDDPTKRAMWTSVATIIGYVDVPIVYFSVKWWNSLHQKQSSPSTISRDFLVPLLLNAVGMLIVMSSTMTIRGRAAERRLQEEIAPPELLEGELATGVAG